MDGVVGGRAPRVTNRVHDYESTNGWLLPHFFFFRLSSLSAALLSSSSSPFLLISSLLTLHGDPHPRWITMEIERGEKKKRGGGRKKSRGAGGRRFASMTMKTAGRRNSGCHRSSLSQSLPLYGFVDVDDNEELNWFTTLPPPADRAAGTSPHASCRRAALNPHPLGLLPSPSPSSTTSLDPSLLQHPDPLASPSKFSRLRRDSRRCSRLLGKPAAATAFPRLLSQAAS